MSTANNNATSFSGRIFLNDLATPPKSISEFKEWVQTARVDILYDGEAGFSLIGEGETPSVDQTGKPFLVCDDTGRPIYWAWWRGDANCPGGNCIPGAMIPLENPITGECKTIKRTESLWETEILKWSDRGWSLADGTNSLSVDLTVDSTHNITVSHPDGTNEPIPEQITATETNHFFDRGTHNADKGEGWATYTIVYTGSSC